MSDNSLPSLLEKNEIKTSPKQDTFVKDFILRKFNYYVLVGVTGSGKSFIANFAFYNMLFVCPENSSMVIIGNTKKSVLSNVIQPLLDLDNKNSKVLKMRMVNNSPVLLFPKRKIIIDIFGAKDEASFKSLRGSSRYCIMADEGTIFPESVISEIIMRLRAKNEDNDLQVGYLLLTGNPSRIDNIVKRNFIDNVPAEFKGKVGYYEFSFNDNPTMTKELVDNFKTFSSGLHRKNLVEGVWANNTDDTLVPFDKIVYLELDEFMEKFHRTELIWAHLDFAFGGEDTNALTIMGKSQYENSLLCFGLCIKGDINEEKTQLLIKSALDSLKVQILFLEDNQDKTQTIGKRLHPNYKYYHESENKERKISYYLGILFKSVNIKLYFLKDMEFESYMRQLLNYTGVKKNKELDDVPDSLSSLARELMRRGKIKINKWFLDHKDKLYG